MTTHGNLRLKVAIVETGRTQRRLALDTAIGEVRLSAIVRGTVRPSPDEQRAIARVLRRSVKDLFGEADDARPARRARA
jgi:transcriptional regulator with XRE-family HTH domain